MPVLRLETYDGEELDEYDVPPEEFYRVEGPDGALICELSEEGG